MKSLPHEDIRRFAGAQVTTRLADSNKMQGQAASPFYYVGLTRSRTYDGVSIGRRSRTVRVVSSRPNSGRSGLHNHPVPQPTEPAATPR